MRQEIAELWVKALRSGEYTQAAGVLRRDDSFCCLGVLCDLYREATSDGTWDETPRSEPDGLPVYAFAGAEETLPNEVITWAGMETPNGILDPVESGAEEMCLSGLNDDGSTFSGLALVIEQYAAKL